MARRKREPKLGKVLNELHQVFPALTAAWLLDTDGFHVAGDRLGQRDADTVCALCASALASVERMGREIGQGEPSSLVVGLREGALVLHSIDAETWLAVEVGQREQLGMAQLAVRYARPLLATTGG
ncbi:MAG: roadblock/LC7 domain-containing protein [Deltaproteobacteria bacterium]|nr:roadblock/LC7 domain-containing protein [Deltaproteobacteria bacterium]